MAVHRYFEGWYFKQQGKDGTVALIPALHIDARGNKSASVQIVTDSESFYFDLPWKALIADRQKLQITAGNSRFSPAGIHVDIVQDGVTAAGDVIFGPLAALKSDIMGPFRFAPGMECRHSVFSMVHEASGGLCINGHTYVFQNDLGYIEGDRGRSFPKRYVWTQCAWHMDKPCSLMISAADIPYLGMSFTGVIAFVYLHGREYRLATYHGARIVHIGNDEVVIKQGKYTLSAHRLDSGAILLRAPVGGGMTRMIREAPSCRVKYRFTCGGETLIDQVMDQAGFENEGMQSIGCDSNRTAILHS